MTKFYMEKIVVSFLAFFGVVFLGTFVQSMPIWPDQLPVRLMPSPPLPQLPEALGLGQFFVFSNRHKAVPKTVAKVSGVVDEKNTASDNLALVKTVLAGDGNGPKTKIIKNPEPRIGW